MSIRELSRKSKRELVRLVLDDAARRGRCWVLGGPAQWSKDELVSYIVRETTLVSR